MLRLTSLIGIEVRRRGVSLGRLVDLAAGEDGPHPAIHSAWARLHRHRPTGADLDAGFEITEDALILADDAAAIEEPQAALLLARHVLDAQLIDMQERRLVRVGDVILDEDGEGLSLAGIETGSGPVLRRIWLGGLAPRAHSETIDWADLHFTSTRADTLQLTVPRSAIRHLPVERIGARPGRRFGRVMRARRHAPR